VGLGLGCGGFGLVFQTHAVVCARQRGLGLVIDAGVRGRHGPRRTGFLLKYFLASQSAIMWLCFFTVMAFLCFSAGLLQAKMRPVSSHDTLFSIATGFAWTASVFGFVGLLVRWHESYLLRPDAGHIPVSNLYEVFILFMVITALMYLYYAARYQAAKLGAFVYGFMCLLVGFVLWYSFERGAHQIQPLIPALQSWWMKIHVPANFMWLWCVLYGSGLGHSRIVGLAPAKAKIHVAIG
jgi:ABC-type transport system involved in cytochrome c biogenesis permease subunit